MTRQEHLDWCKERALQYVDNGELNTAFTSMASDLNKHPETHTHPGLELELLLLMNDGLNTRDKMRKFIEDFN